jgi:hypothetical protein
LVIQEQHRLTFFLAINPEPLIVTVNRSEQLTFFVSEATNRKEHQPTPEERAKQILNSWWQDAKTPVSPLKSVEAELVAVQTAYRDFLTFADNQKRTFIPQEFTELNQTDLASSVVRERQLIAEAAAQSHDLLRTHSPSYRIPGERKQAKDGEKN